MADREPPVVEVTPSHANERQVLANLIQLYVHGFSEYKSGTPRGELQDDGRFPDYPLDAYWRKDNQYPLLFRLNGRLVGFALVNADAHGDAPVERNMAEFFVVRKHRRSGVGAVAARHVFSLYPGLWEAAVARRNTGAVAFWRIAINGHPQVCDLKEADFAGEKWEGPVFRFRIDPSATDPKRASIRTSQ